LPAEFNSALEMMQPKDFVSALPQTWQRELRGFHFEFVKEGMSDARLFRLRGPASNWLYLKAWPPGGLTDFRSELERTRWLSGKGVRVPDLVRVFDDGRRGAVMMTAMPGAHPQQVRQPTALVVRHLAQGLRALHCIAAADCPFDETTAVRLARAREMIKDGRVAGEHFDERNRGRSPQAIYEQLVASTPQPEDVVVVHGDAKFDNLLIDDDGNLGFIDCGHAGRGDRYLDLEAITSDIEEHFGAQWIEPFARDYGVQLDPAKLLFFNDLYELF
jgi:aminoglycoside 3'-phosphotransferase II